jgi:hypothetical protein
MNYNITIICKKSHISLKLLAGEKVGIFNNIFDNFLIKMLSSRKLINFYSKLLQKFDFNKANNLLSVVLRVVIDPFFR